MNRRDFNRTESNVTGDRAIQNYSGNYIVEFERTVIVLWPKCGVLQLCGIKFTLRNIYNRSIRFLLISIYREKEGRELLISILIVCLYDKSFRERKSKFT